VTLVALTSCHFADGMSSLTLHSFGPCSGPTLEDSHIASFGLIRFLFHMSLYFSSVLDLSPCLVAFSSMPFPSDTNPCCSFDPCACCCTSIPFNFAHYLDTEHLHTMPHGFSPLLPAEPQLSIFLFPNFSLPLHSINCHPPPWTCHI